MAAKAVKYEVKFRDPILSTWRTLAYNVTKQQAETYEKTCQFDVVKTRLSDD